MDLFFKKKKSATEERKEKEVENKKNARIRRRVVNMRREIIVKQNLNEGKLAKRAALKKRIEKAKKKGDARRVFRMKTAKTLGVNWKRVRITNWKTKAYIVK